MTTSRWLAALRVGTTLALVVFAGCGSRQEKARAEDHAVWVYPHRHWVTAVAFSPDGRYVLTGSRDTGFRRWVLATGRGERELRGKDPVWSITFDAEGRRMAVAGGSHLRLGPVDRLAELAVVAKAPAFTTFDRVFFLPDGKSLLATPKRICTYEIATGAKIRCYGRFLFLGIEDADVSRDGRHVAFARWFSKKIRLLDLAAEESVVLGDHDSFAADLAFSPDGAHLLSGGDNTARLWDLAARREARRFGPLDSDVWAVAMTPDAARILTGNADGTVHVLDAATGGELRRLTGHASMVIVLAVSPDGRYALSGSMDNTARLWDLANLDRPPGSRMARPAEGVTLQEELAVAGDWSDLRRLYVFPQWTAMGIIGFLATWLGGTLGKRGPEPRSPWGRSIAGALAPAVLRYLLLYLPAAVLVLMAIARMTGQPAGPHVAGNTVKLALLLAVVGAWNAWFLRELWNRPPTGNWAFGTLVAYPIFYYLAIVPALYLAKYLAGRFGYPPWRQEIATAILQRPVLHPDTWPNLALLLLVLAVLSFLSYRRALRLVSLRRARLTP